MTRRKIETAGLALAAMLLIGGCSGQPLSTREKGTGVGALLGAGTGAIVGAAVGHPGAGAAIGGGLGAATGFAVGNEMQNLENENAHTRRALQSQQRELSTQRAEIHRLQNKTRRNEGKPESATRIQSKMERFDAWTAPPRSGPLQASNAIQKCYGASTGRWISLRFGATSYGNPYALPPCTLPLTLR